MTQNRVKVESKDSDGKDVVVYVTRPTNDDYTQAQIVSSAAFKKAILNGAILKSKLEDYLKEQNIWNHEKEAKLKEYDEKIREGLISLKKGGIKLNEAKDVAVRVRTARVNRTVLLSQRNEYDDFTAESQAQNAKFDYLVSVCVKDEEGSRVFSDVDDYKSRGDEPFVSESAGVLANMLYGLDQDWELKLQENQFLKKYGFVDDDLRLVNKEGKYVSIDGKLIDEEFRYIDENGNFVNYDGERIDEDGLPVAEFSPFLNDDGSPIIDTDGEQEDAPKKRGRKPQPDN